MGKSFFVFNKRGNEIVEAAIVVPIFILIISSLVSLGIFYFSSFNTQCRVQREIMEEINATSIPIRRVSNRGETYGNLMGLPAKALGVEYSTYAFAIHEGMIIRTGELVGLR